MTEQLVLLAFVGWLAASLMFGLWWGERGRRIAAENWKLTGDPEAAEAVSTRPSKEAEDRFLEAAEAVSKETEDNMVKSFLAEAKAKGVNVTEKQIRKDVKAMLSGEDVMG